MASVKTSEVTAVLGMYIASAFKITSITAAGQ
jgi:hypothetical protein